MEKHALELLKEREAKIYLQRSQAIYYETTSGVGSSASGASEPSSTDQPQPLPNYITRRRRKHIRTELFCLSLDQLELYALSDTTWHGRQKCYNILREIDHDSPAPGPSNDYPEDATGAAGSLSSQFDPAENYSVLWCRHINFNVGGDFKLTFRDYTQPLVRMQKWNMWGKLLGAEYSPAFRSKRTVKMGKKLLFF